VAGAIAAQLASLPRRFIHGEFTPANVLVQRGGGRIRIRPLDWELAGIGPGVLDVAALTAGNWSALDRHSIENAYSDACPPHLRPTAHDLDLARLLLAAQWSGWCDGWEPPAEQRQDWRGEAEYLLERLGL
jgi:aminoglycoside phosphotransferase (APT) family kinase protein